MATVNTPAVLRGGKAAERAARDALASLSANLPPAPDSFEHGAQYRVRLTRSVPAGAGGSAPSPPIRPIRLRDVWMIDPVNWLLDSGDIFEGDERVDHFEFSEIRIDAGLKESWFRF